MLPEDMSYLVSDLRPFTDYTFRVTASTTVGEGPAADITEKTREQGWTTFRGREGGRRLQCSSLLLWLCFDPVHALHSFSVPSSVLDVSYQNISSTSIHVSWIPPLNPNGRITHYTVYGLQLDSNQALKWMTNSTSLLIEGRVVVKSLPWLLPHSLH